ncbi:MAG: glycosyltransferase family 4 protein [Leptolyngbyaceae cyanobacterium RM2_2_4]|nr:glycosyltransferase family 4 protein [Leptolyngbyaceae cyanobacterium SM1_4_3]NJN57722.1 glycosyltransferase family 4 protein [Leptolyngbyaceae cyanobacterium SL_5_9]NJO50250.1 glycosyltransferase family 4 protein [Leptolyngbyaceae cyanobacterium RM2_2_4]NJO76361.1 glycosyltransferase family 4 protein [Leptolyngbyaceae cyanobacterium RM1_406_9]
MKTAIVHEWLVTYAGSERVVEQMLTLYPEADLFSLVEFLPPELRSFIHHKPVQTSFLQRLPFAKTKFRHYLPLMPLAIERFDLSDYDLVLSSSHAVAKGVITRADQLHISYVHTPIRYAWDLQQQYLKGSKLERGAGAFLTHLVLHYLRLWDLATANRVDYFLANSRYVARRIWKTYRRSAQVIYPPVAVDRFQPKYQRDDFYLILSRFVPYKRVDLVVEAFARLGLPLVVIGEGGDRLKIERLATPNIQLLGHQPDAVVADHMARCKAFVFAAAEDFGIAPVEAQAAGAPVIAYGKGGVTESVIAGKTGIFFPYQTVESLVEAVQKFESGLYCFSPEELRQNAERFSPERFRQQMIQFIDQKWTKFRRRDAIEY